MHGLATLCEDALKTAEDKVLYRPEFIGAKGAARITVPQASQCRKHHQGAASSQSKARRPAEPASCEPRETAEGVTLNGRLDGGFQSGFNFPRWLC